MQVCVRRCLEREKSSGRDDDNKESLQRRYVLKREKYRGGERESGNERKGETGDKWRD